MDRIVKVAAGLANIVLLGFSLLILSQSHNGRDLFFAVLGIVPALLNSYALYSGPDWEERRLSRQLNKARMRAELQKLDASKI